MVVVKIELWPLGSQRLAQTIGIAKITNDGSGTMSKGNYNIELMHSGKYYGKPGIWKSGKLANHNRNLSPYHLVAAALNETLKK